MQLPWSTDENNPIYFQISGTKIKKLSSAAARGLLLPASCRSVRNMVELQLTLHRHLHTCMHTHMLPTIPFCSKFYHISYTFNMFPYIMRLCASFPFFIVSNNTAENSLVQYRKWGFPYAYQFQKSLVNFNTESAFQPFAGIPFCFQ